MDSPQIPAALAKSLPAMPQGSPMMDPNTKPDGALAEAAKKIAAATLQLVEQISVVMRGADESKRRALLKAIDLLTSEFPPSPDAAQQGQPNDAVMQSIQGAGQQQPAPSQMMPPASDAGGAPNPMQAAGA